MHTPGAHAHERLDCSVRAVSVACGVPYTVAHALHREHGRRDRGRTSQRTLEAVARRLRLKRATGVQRITLAAFLRSYPEGKFLVRRRDHLFAVVDGTVHDWPVGTGPRSRVLEAWHTDDCTGPTEG